MSVQLRKAGILLSIGMMCVSGVLAQTKSSYTGPTVELQFVHGYTGSDRPVIEDMIKNFNASHPNIVVKGSAVAWASTWQQLGPLVSAGKAPDVLAMTEDVIKKFSLRNALTVLTPTALKTATINAGDYYNTMWAMATDKGNVFGVPFGSVAGVMYYNKDLFDEAKVPYPSSNDTFTTFADKLTKLKAALGSDYYGICLPADFARMGAFAYANGWQQFNTKGKSNLLDPRFVSAFNFYTGLAKNKVAVQPSELSAGWPGDCLKGGKVGVAIEGGWLVDFLKTNAPNLKYGTALMPFSDTTKKRGNFLYTVGWAINSGTKNQAAAIKVLNALTSPQAQEFVLSQGLAIPSRSALASSSSFKGTDAKTLNSVAIFQGATSGNVQSFSFGPAGTDWMKPVNEALAAVLSGQKSSADALKKAQQDMTTFQNR